MAYCDYITDNIMTPCDRPKTEIKLRGYIYNKSEVSFDENTSELKVKRGQKGFVFEQKHKQPFKGTNTQLVVGTLRSYYRHTIKAVIYDTDIIQQLRNARVVVVIDRGDKFEAFGLKNGLTLQEAVFDYWDEDNDGGWVITLVEEGADMTKEVFVNDTHEEAREKLEGTLIESQRHEVVGKTLIAFDMAGDNTVVLDGYVKGNTVYL
jgi:hypothetical protein